MCASSVSANSSALVSSLIEGPAQLSYGQLQHVALARAVISEQPVWLLDEPLSNFDAKPAHDMRVEIRSFQLPQPEAFDARQ